MFPGLLPRIAVSALLMLVLAGCARSSASRSFNISAAWHDYEQIVVESRNGRIDVAPGDSAQVEITGLIRARGESKQQADKHIQELEVVAETDSDDPKSMRITFIVPEHINRYSPGADITVRVPERCAARLSTSNGAVVARSLTGTLAIKTSNGQIEASDIDGPVTAETSNGAIQLVSINDSVDARSSNGRVRVENVSGKCTLRTSNGSVHASGLKHGVVAHSSNGPLELEYAAQPGEIDEIDLLTSNGSIKLVVPASLAADLDLTTSNGRISTNFGGAAAAVKSSNKSRYVAALNGGGVPLRTRTSNGGIQVECR